MQHDHVSWHTGSDYPTELPEEAAATHIGMFFAWAAQRGLVGTEHMEDYSEEFEDELLTRKVTPGQYLLRTTSGLADTDLTRQGNSFARDYYGEGHYYADLANVGAMVGRPGQFMLPDTWEMFEVLDNRFEAWCARED
jgi:hypothetical protein